jgi:hypothetical protein
MNSHNTIINSFYNYESFAIQPLFDLLKIDANINLSFYSYLFFKNLEEYFNLKKDYLMRKHPTKASDISEDEFTLLKNTNVKLDIVEFTTLFNEKVNKKYKEGIATNVTNSTQTKKNNLTPTHKYLHS